MIDKDVIKIKVDNLKKSYGSLEVLKDINPRDSWRAPKAFRQHIAVEMAKRCLIEATKRCGGEIK